MNIQEFEANCWQYYHVLENDFMEIERYAAFVEENKNTYSVEFIKQFQTICSEIDVVCKLYSIFCDPESNPQNIKHYANIILSHNQDITGSEVQLKINPSFIISPWNEWSCDHSDFSVSSNPRNITPSWWKDYNKVKHERLNVDENGSQYYKRATLGNVINALSALYVLEMNLYKELIRSYENHRITIPSKESSIFIYLGWENHLIRMGDRLIGEVISES